MPLPVRQRPAAITAHAVVVAKRQLVATWTKNIVDGTTAETTDTITWKRLNRHNLNTFSLHLPPWPETQNATCQKTTHAYTTSTRPTCHREP
jgi:hypothetical protein